MPCSWGFQTKLTYERFSPKFFSLNQASLSVVPLHIALVHILSRAKIARNNAAQQVVGMPAPLAVQMGGVAPAKLTFDQACLIVNPMTVTSSKQPLFSHVEDGTADFGDLPLKDFAAKGNLSHIYDILHDYKEAIDIDKIRGLLNVRKYMELPQGIAAAAPCVMPYTMDISILARDGKTTIMKHLHFDKAVKPQVARAMATGIPLQLAPTGAHPKDLMKAMLYMTERMTGTHLLHDTFANMAATELKTEDELDVGFDFIEEECPRTNERLAKTRWVEKQLNKPSSPIYGWNRGLIQEAVRHLDAQGALATTTRYYPLCYMDFAPWFKVILDDIVPTLLSNSVLFLGKAGFGKTPAMVILAIAISRYHCNKKPEKPGLQPAYRTASNLDFFRGERGTPERPDIFDDGDLNSQDIAKQKTFLDVSMREAMVYARWGASKFTQHQCRFAADNKFDADAEPQGPEVPSETMLLDMMRTAFPVGTSMPDKEAVLKRATVILNTSNYLYVRRCGLKQQVVRYELGASFLNEDAGMALRAFLKYDKVRPELTLSRLVDKEQDFFRQAIARAAANEGGTSDDADGEVEGGPEGDADVKFEGVPVKQEPWTIWGCALQSKIHAAAPIDLSDSPMQPKEMIDLEEPPCKRHCGPASASASSSSSSTFAPVVPGGSSASTSEPLSDSVGTRQFEADLEELMRLESSAAHDEALPASPVNDEEDVFGHLADN